MAGIEPKRPTSTADDVPTVSGTARVLGWCLWFGMPAVLVVAAIAFVRTGWPALILIAVLPPAAGLLALGLLGLRQPAITGWDDRSLYLRLNGKSEPVPWDNVEWFHKLWLTHRLEGGGKAWIATLIRYRQAGASRRALITVCGVGAADSIGLLPGRYETVFDKRVPAKNWARRNEAV